MTKEISISHWGIFHIKELPVIKAVHEPEVRDAIRRKHKIFEDLQFPKMKIDI